LGAVAGPVVVAALVLAACGSESAGPSRETVEMSEGSTSFQTVPPETTTTAPLVVDGIQSTSQEYEVQPGDYPIKVATDFEVPLEDLINFNGWASANEFPGPGEVIKIPPGGRAVDGSGGGDVAADAGDSGDVAETDETGDPIEAAGGNCGEGTHTIADGDYPIKVAEQYDVDPDALRDANLGNPAYANFIPGGELIIPAAEGCEE
jgi:LysM repeat protein